MTPVPRPITLLALSVTAVFSAGVAASASLPDAPRPVPVRVETTGPTGTPTPQAVAPPPPVPVALAVRAPAPPPPPAHHPGDPATWPSRQLAAQLVFSCVQTSDLGTAVGHAQAGLGGIVVMGRPMDAAALTAGLAAVRSASPFGITPMVASDEEGGRVQRLRGLLGELPSAAVMGSWSDAQIEQTAHDYAVRMRSLGVQMALSPVADLAVPGAYPSETGRAFSADPHRVTGAAVAWSTGLARGGVLSAVKHWPGHGHAVDSHMHAPSVPPLPALEGSDLLPFDAVLRSGANVVMVGHLRSEGLTEPGLPATLSPNAMRVLRERAGPNAVVLTDSVSMAASSAALGIAPAEAAVRSLQAGADWAMSCVDPLAAVAAVQGALDSGRLPREAAVASASRILHAKNGLGLLAVGPTTAPPTGSLESASALGGVVTLTGHAADPDSQEPSNVQVLVNGVAGAPVPTAAGTRVYVVPVPAAAGSEVCVVALNTGAGGSTPLGCVTA